MTPALETSSEKALLWALRMLVLGAAGMAVLLALMPAAGHDQLWFLLMAERWLHGAALYGPEIFDSNTPAVVWLSAIPAGLAAHLGLGAVGVAKLLVVLLECGVVWLCAGIVQRIETGFTTAGRLFLSFAYVSLFAVAAARDFGQRDQLAGLLCLPYVLLAAEERDGVLPLRLVSGLLAGVGVCLKPQLVLIPIAVEMALLLWNNFGSARAGGGSAPAGRMRSLLGRPEPLLLLVVGVSFLAAVRQFAPLYFSLTLPTLLATYWAIGHLGVSELLRQAPQLHVMGALAVALVLAGMRRGGSRPPVAMLLVSGVAATAAYYAQGTGWYYQQLPAIGFLGTALAMELTEVARGRRFRVPRWLPFAAGVLAVLALALTFHFSGYRLGEDLLSRDFTYATETPDAAFFSALAPGTPVAILTTSVEDTMMPIARYRLTWAQRTNNLWMLPAIFRASNPSAREGDRRVPERLTPGRLAEVSEMQRRWMVEDLKRWQPKLVLVERCQAPEVQCQELEDRHDDLLAFFLEDPAFVAVWAHYRFVRGSGPYDAYLLSAPF